MVETASTTTARERIERDADFAEPEASGVGPPAGGDQRLIDFDRLAVARASRAASPPRCSKRVGRQPKRSRTPARRQLVAQAVAHVLVEAAQHVVGAQHLGHLGAELGEQAGELDRDIAAPDHQQPPRKHWQIEDLVGA